MVVAAAALSSVAPCNNYYNINQMVTSLILVEGTKWLLEVYNTLAYELEFGILILMVLEKNKIFSVISYCNVQFIFVT